jgi:hypothetical protein
VRDIIPFQVVPSAFAAEWAEQCDQWGRKTLAALEATARMLAVGSVASMGRFESLTSALSRCFHRGDAVVARPLPARDAQTRRWNVRRASSHTSFRE